MESTLYEFGFHFHWFDCFKILVFVFPIMLWIFSGVFAEKIKWMKIVIKVFSVCMMLLLLWAFYIDPIISYFKIRNEIDLCNVSIVEGEVCDFQTPSSSWAGHVIESFHINEIEFSYSGTENYGYNRLRCDGGVIEGNGQRLKITYYINSTTNKNIICKIETVQ